jgi:hypothetical protein
LIDAAAAATLTGTGVVVEIACPAQGLAAACQVEPCIALASTHPRLLMGRSANKGPQQYAR